MSDEIKMKLRIIAATVAAVAVFGSALTTLSFHLSIPDRVREHDAKFLQVDKALAEQRETLIRIEERLIALQTQLKMMDAK